MKIAKKLSSVIIALVVCAMLAATAWATVTYVSYTGELDQNSISTSAKSQTVTLKVTAGKDVTMDAFQAEVMVPYGWSIQSISSDNRGTLIDKGGAMIWYAADAENVTADLLATVVIEVPENVDPGEYEIGFQIIEMSRQYGSLWDSGKLITVPLTVTYHAEGEGCTYVPGEPEWSADYTSCTVIGTCGCGGDPVTATAINITSDETPGTCTTPAVVTYTASFEESWIDDLSTSVTGETDPDNHTYVDGTCSECGASDPDAPVEPVAGKITWIGADGTTILEEKDYEGGATPEYSGETPVKEGYVFAGWSTEAEGAGTQYPVDTALPTVDGDATYYAYFTEDGSSDPDEPVAGKITWIGADGTTILEEKDYEAGATPEYSGETPAKEGYVFAGWSTEAEGAGTQYPVDTALPTVDGDATYYAYFTEDGSTDEPTDIHVIDKTNGTADYTVDGSVVTVTHSIACKVGYLDQTSGKYVAIPAVANSDGSYSFTAPEGVTEVLLVVKGDLTFDGKMNAGDKMALAKALLPANNTLKTTLDAEQTFAADVNTTVGVNAGDKMTLAKALLPANNNLKTPLAW